MPTNVPLPRKTLIGVEVIKSKFKFTASNIFFGDLVALIAMILLLS